MKNADQRESLTNKKTICNILCWQEQDNHVLWTQLFGNETGSQLERNLAVNINKDAHTLTQK